MPMMEMDQPNTELFLFEMVSEEEVLVYSVDDDLFFYMLCIISQFFFPQLCLEIPYGYWKKMIKTHHNFWR